MNFADFDTVQLHAWVTARGKCVGTMREPDADPDDDPWHDEPPRGRYGPHEQRKRAQAACSGCLARKACLELALQHERDAGASWGYWGGTSPNDRRELIAQRKRVERMVVVLGIALVSQNQGNPRFPHILLRTALRCSSTRTTGSPMSLAGKRRLARAA